MEVIIVGGFLGAGKTTVITQWIQRKVAQGKTPGVIVNDLSNNLVDQQWFLAQGHQAHAIWGKCVCTSIESLWETIDSLKKQGTDCIFLEPVGSHLDLSQQILPPLLGKDVSMRFNPITIIVDGPRILQTLDKKQAFIQEMMEIQFQGADLFFVNKCDLLSQGQEEKLRIFLEEMKVPFFFGSAVSPECVSSFFSWVESNDIDPMGSIPETKPSTLQTRWNPLGLNWLSMNLSFSGSHEMYIQEIWALCEKLLARYELGHLKLFLQSEGGWIKVNQTDWTRPPTRHASITYAAQHWKGILNLRCFAPKASLSALRREVYRLLR